MKYSEAFAKLGYKLKSPRQDWSAENSRGVCISIWRKEISYSNGMPSIDTRINAGSIELWGRSPGNALRKRHLKCAVESFDGRVDVVIVEGTPGEGVSDAHPWIVHDRKGAHWRITYIDTDSGHFAVAVFKP
jgi:hypothetical protein